MSSSSPLHVRMYNSVRVRVRLPGPVITQALDSAGPGTRQRARRHAQITQVRADHMSRHPCSALTARRTGYQTYWLPDVLGRSKSHSELRSQPHPFGIIGRLSLGQGNVFGCFSSRREMSAAARTLTAAVESLMLTARFRAGGVCAGASTPSPTGEGYGRAAADCHGMPFRSDPGPASVPVLHRPPNRRLS
jgi:hypothetical protein